MPSTRVISSRLLSRFRQKLSSCSDGDAWRCRTDYCYKGNAQSLASKPRPRHCPGRDPVEYLWT